MDVQQNGAQPTIKLTTRTDRSASMFMLQHLVKTFQTLIVHPPKELATAGSMQLQPLESVLKSCHVKERIVEDVYVYDITPKDQQRTCQRSQKHMYYFAGGGWQSPPTSEHWRLLAEYATKLPDIHLTLVSYPLAPKSPAPTSFPQLMKLYRKIMDADEDVILAGDSAGGNIILSLTLQALHETPDSPCPKAIVAMSPSTDLRRSNPDMKALEKHDPLLRMPFVRQTAGAWRAEWDATDIRISPLMADVSILAKRHIQIHGVTAGYDVLGPDGVLFRNKCSEAGVTGEWLHWEKQMHCFPLAFNFKLPESVQAKDWIIDVLRRI